MKPLTICERFEDTRPTQEWQAGMMLAGHWWRAITKFAEQRCDGAPWYVLQENVEVFICLLSPLQIHTVLTSALFPPHDLQNYAGSPRVEA